MDYTTLSPELEERVQRAVDNFMQGYGCCQSVSLAGLDCGQTDGADREGKSACYKVVQQLLEKSREQNGSLICAEILGLKGHDKAVSTYEASPRTAEYYKSRPCAAKVESAARIFAEYLQSKAPLT